MPTLSLLERTEVTEASRKATGRRLKVQIINPGWGSTGYYPQAVLEQAAKDRVFPAGTHMYIDHPTESEKYERPGRSVRDLAAVLASDARWDGTALVAEVYVFAPYRDVLADMKESIGTSIRAVAEASQGEAEGRSGYIVERLVEAQSVDFVTKAGRGGRILQVLESARQELVDAVEGRNVGQWLESRLHQHFTNLADDMAADGHLTREERIALSSAIGDALTAFASKVEAEQPHLYQRDPYADPTATTAVTESVPATRSDGKTHTESQEKPMGTKQIEESEFTRLTEAAGRVETLESERNTEKTRADKAEQDLTEARKSLEEAKTRAVPALLAEENKQLKTEVATLRAAEAAREIVASTLSEAYLADAQKARLRASLMSDLPMSEGKLDEDGLRDRCTQRVNEAENEAAELLKAAGIGTPRGLGGLTTPATEAAATQSAEVLAESFKELGLSESATATAVKGR